MRSEFEYSYRVHKFDLTLGLTDFEVPIHAERIDYVSPTNGPELSIRLQRKSNDALPLRPNGSIEAPFTRIYISAPATATTVFLMIGAPSAVRVTGRDVSISGSINAKDLRERSIENAQYFRKWRSGSGATLHGQQVFNPSGSTKTVYVLGAWVSCFGVLNGLMFGVFNTALATPTANLKNQVSGAADSTAQTREETYAASKLDTGAVGPQALVVRPSAVNVSVYVPLFAKLVANQGYMVEGMVNTQGVDVSWEIAEL